MWSHSRASNNPIFTETKWLFMAFLVFMSFRRYWMYLGSSELVVRALDLQSRGVAVAKIVDGSMVDSTLRQVNPIYKKGSYFFFVYFLAFGR